MSIDWSQLIPWLIIIPAAIIGCAAVVLVTDRQDRHADQWPVHDPHNRDREDAA